MARLLNSLSSLNSFLRREHPGTPPGALTPHPSQPALSHETRLRVMAYSAEEFLEQEIQEVEELIPLLQRFNVVWVDVDGLANVVKLEKLRNVLELHPLAMEDAVRANQRPKIEPYPKHLFMVFRMISLAERVNTEQLSVFVGKKAVVTIQGEVPGDCLETVRNRIRSPDAYIRGRAADYLAYALVDAVVDNYFPVLESFGEQLETLEQEILDTVEKTDAARIQAVKHDLMAIRRAVWPIRDAVAVLHRDPSPYIEADTQIYLRDVYDHSAQLLEIMDTYREVVSGLMEIHLSSMSNRMNEIMKALTVVSMIFIPMNFIAGVYGMNFDSSRSPFNMPELGWYFGYPWALGLMVLLASGLLVVFWRKHWLG